MVFAFFAALSFLTLFLGFFPGWFDSPEFALAAKTLGVSHPSGHPLWVVLGHAFTFLPVGSVAFRTSLFSSVCVATGIALVGRIVRQSIPKAPPALAFVAMLTLLLHPSLALQSTRTEIYALFFAVFCGVLWCLLRALETEDARYLLLSGFLSGLAAALQPLLAVTLLPPLAFCFLNRRSLRTIVPALFVGLVGVSVVIFLPLRASTHPLLNWDDPETLASFWKAFSARDYRVFFHSPVSSRGLADFFRADILRLLPIPVLMLVMIGAATGWRISRRKTAFLVVTFLSALFPWVAKDFYLRNPDAHAYVTAPLAPLAILAACGISRIFSVLPLRPWIRISATCSFFFLAFFPLMPTALRSLPATGSEDAFALSDRIDTLPPRSEVRLVSDHWLFPVWYRSFVEGRRPDLTIIAPELLRAAWYRNQVRDRIARALPDRTFAEADLEPSRSFLSLCADRLTEEDPYGIRQAVCAQTFWTSTQGSVAGGRKMQGLRLLENLLPGRTHSRECLGAGAPAFPFPLYDDPDDRFLIDRSELEARFALLYLECGQRESARVLLNDARALSVKQRQLLAWLQALRGEVATALETCRPRPGDNRGERGYLWITRAALGLSTRRMSDVADDIRNARRALGDVQPVKSLEVWMNGTGS